MDTHAEQKARKEKKREAKRNSLKHKKVQDHDPKMMKSEKVIKSQISKQNIFIMMGIILITSLFVFYNMQ